MKTYNLNAQEIDLVLSALRYTAEYGYTAELTDGEIDEYSDILALIERLEPKPVKKEGWVGLYPEGEDGMPSMCGAYVTEEEAREDCPGANKFVKVTWEE
jgi:hypothetical protein